MTRLDTLVALANRAQAYAPKVTHAGNLAGSWYRIVNAANDSADVMIYDEIGGYGITASAFVAELNAVTAKTVNVHINSPGGSVFDGIAIHAALVNHKATVNTVVDGIAASAASFIMQAGDTRSMEKPGTVMIHDASGLVLGNAADMREMADLLDQMSDTIAQIYADRAGGTVADFRALMQAETWFTSSQAVAAGLVDTVLNDNAPAPEDRRSQLIRARARAQALRG